MNVLLRGIGGSRAHGLAHKDSDIDYRGVFAYPTVRLFELESLPETIVKSAPEPDSTTHELSKFLRLALKNNPDVLEVFGLGGYSVFDEEWAPRLLELQSACLYTDGIRKAYGNYARSVFQDFVKSSPTEWTPGTRQFKNVKHMFRLQEVGIKTLTQGRVITRVENPDWYLKTLPQMGLGEVIHTFERGAYAFATVNSVLADNPDIDRINKYLVDYRKAH